MTGYEYVRGEIATLLPQKQIRFHIDLHEFHRLGVRLHIPLITNDLCKMSWMNDDGSIEKAALTVGNVYNINNRIMHSAENYGSEPRVHLVFDMMPIA